MPVQAPDAMSSRRKLEPASRSTWMSCVAVGDCGNGRGHITSKGSCSQIHLACCVAEAACPAETFSCCGGAAKFRPSCDDGKLVCAAGQKQCP